MSVVSRDVGAAVMGGSGSGRKKALTVQRRPGLKALQEVVRVDVTDEAFEEAMASSLVLTGQAPAGLRAQVQASPTQLKNAIVALLACRETTAGVSKILGVTETAVKLILYRMRKADWTNDDDQLDYDLVPTAIEALRRDLEDPTSKGHQKAYLAVLEGRGKLWKEQPSAGPGVAAVLNVKFEMPEGGVKPVLNGQVVGVPRE
jgi:hypothetical protein